MNLFRIKHCRSMTLREYKEIKDKISWKSIYSSCS